MTRFPSNNSAYKDEDQVTPKVDKYNDNILKIIRKQQRNYCEEIELFKAETLKNIGTVDTAGIKL